MIKILCIVLSILTIGIYCQSVSVSFSASATSSTSDFRNRQTTARIFNTSIVIGAFIKSFEVTKLPNETSLDGIRFAIYTINPILGLGGVAPTAVGAYYAAQASIQNGTGDNSGYNFDVSASANYMAIRLFSLEEVDVNGNVVNTIQFNSITWSLSSANFASTESTVNFPTWVLSGSSNNIPITLTHISSNQYGTVNIPGYSTNPVITPKGLEIIFGADFTNYNYQSSNNYLRLVYYTVTGNANRQTNITSTVSSIPKRTYSYVSSAVGGVNAGVRFDSNIVVNNNQVSTNTNITVGASINSVFGIADVLTQVNTVLGANAQLTRTNINFPVNCKTKVTYDPTIFFGSDTYSQPATNSASSVFISALLLILIFIFNF